MSRSRNENSGRGERTVAPRRIETHPDSPTVLNLATLGVLILVALFVFLRPAIAECS